MTPPPVSRRQFIATTAATAIASRFAHSAEPARRIKVGFLGTAHSHFQEKFRIISASPDWDLVGLCEPDGGLRNRGPSNARWMSETELFEKSEAIIIESGVAEHAGDARRALEADKHIHLEKTPTDTPANLPELLPLVRSR